MRDGELLLHATSQVRVELNGRLKAERRPVMIVDGEPAGERLAHGLATRLPAVELHRTAQSALERMQELQGSAFTSVLELRLPDGGGLPLLAQMLHASPSSDVFVLTAYGSIASAKYALRLGARDYLCKPASVARVASLLRQRGTPEPEPERTPEAEPLELEHPSLDRAIWEYINFVLAEAGSIAGAARRLKIDRRSLRRMLQKNPPTR